MIRTSKKYLEKQNIIKMENVLFEVLSSYNWKDDFDSIMHEFFTPAERVMFAKRVFTMYLIYKKVPYYEIGSALKISTSTVSRYALFMLQSDLKLKEIFRRIEKQEQIINLIDDLFTLLFVQPGIYKNHWQIYSDYKKRLLKRKTSGV